MNSALVKSLPLAAAAVLVCLCAVPQQAAAAQAPAAAQVATAAKPKLPADRDPYFKPEPVYARWGRLAVAEAQQRYPQTAVVDYLHIGRKRLAPGVAEEHFRLWMRDRPTAREWGLHVRIRFEENTNKVLQLELRPL